MDIVKVIFSNLIYNEPFARKVIPYLKEEYFHDKPDSVVFGLIKTFVDKYNTFPSLKTLAIDLSNYEGLSQDMFNQCKDVLFQIKKDEEPVNLEWLFEETEKFCREKALHNAIMESIQIIDGKETKTSKGMIPQLVTDALAVTFDTSIGHDHFEDAATRWDHFHTEESRLPFRLSYFNKITKGGLKRKTLNLLIAPPGVGKSLFMCNFAADNLLMGKNVLYITLEMEDKQISNRIDANMLNISLDDLEGTDKERFVKLVNRVKEMSGGKLIVHEYPTSSASTLHFKQLANELKIKKNFVPDVIYVDYLGICASSRLKLSNQVNSYAVMKAVSEELRAWAKEMDVPLVSAVQFNRSGAKSSEPGLEDTSESYGIPFTADIMLAIIASDELNELGQVMIKQLKNRYNDMNNPNKFVVGIDRSKMKLYDLEETAQVRVLDGDKEKDESRDFIIKKFDKKQEMFEDFT